ncbi:hemerythrin domain-containing protein [Streptomyces sp. PT12]|uniref:hemerythrin domain-containing protein n=1 Tax=Streptomyces sp. PT12 TaxID=1510197 RepID=UPI000DE1B629|nr:hemerythrin domain-containing protein [Streptomyces sp. PT12]RBM17868.1 hypothetical protein DEH69_14455 [Streptomyces sp. PT12]
MIDELRRERERIAALVEELRAVIGDDGAGPARVAAEVDRLMAELNRHLDHEERKLTAVLDGAA